MSSGITLSAGVRANLLSLQNTAQLMQTTQNRLATGKKVTSALDNPINYFTSQSLQSRAGDLNSLLDSMSNGIQTIQAANNGLSAITTTLQSMQSTLNQAQQDSSWQSATYSIDTATVGTSSLKNLAISGGAVTGSVNVALNSVATAGTEATLSASANYLAPSSSAAAATSGGTYRGLTGSATYTFKVNGQDITLDSTTSGSTSGNTFTNAKASVQSQLDARFGSGAFTVGDNTAGDGFKISGKADGTNDVVISNQGGVGAAATQATFAGGTFTALTGADSYSFDFNDGTTTHAITLSTAQGASAATARAAIQTQLDTHYGSGAYTVGGTTGISITGRADGSNSVIISSQATPVSAGGATIAGLGLGTTTQTNTGVTAITAASAGLGTTTSTSLGSPADTYDFTVNDKAVSIAAGTGFNAAISSINSQLAVGGASAFEAFDDSGKIGLREIAAGGAKLTIGGTDATAIFGATLTDQGIATSTASVKTVDQLVASINGDAGLTGKVKATNDNGSLRITNLSTGDLSVVGANSTQVNGSTGGANTQTISGNSVRKSLVQQFNQLRDQLDKLAADSSYNGINLLNGDNLKLTLNETGSSAINVQAKDANGATISIDSTSLGVTQANNSDFDSGTSISATLGKITSALSTLRSQSSSLGSNLSVVQNRQDFTKTMINTLQTGADNLVLADTNQEGANLLALQTRQSLSTTALSLSSQADQAVLSLFG